MYGLYLTLSSWVLFHVATGMTFFADKCHLADLNTTPQVLSAYCQSVRLPSQHPHICLYVPHTCLSIPMRILLRHREISQYRLPHCDVCLMRCACMGA